VTKVKRAEVLDTAKEYVTKDRAQDHGDMEDNFTTIAVYWSEHLDQKLSASDVGIMMSLLKHARMKSNPYHTDNYVDAAGYVACAGELVDTDG
jgi:hypothetical protein